MSLFKSECDLPRKKVVMLHSGGLDSTVLLALAQRSCLEVLSLQVAYGQRHWREMNAAQDTSELFRVTGWPVRVDDSLFQGSSQTDHKVDVPEGHYTDESMRATIVPNRNMVLLANATALAISQKFNLVAYAAHAGDHTIYPDCRPEFIESVAETIFLASDDPKVQLWAPFQYMTKAAIVKLGAELGVPFNLTYSCYNGRARHCGKCGTCRERREAFKIAGVADPTEYEA